MNDIAEMEAMTLQSIFIDSFEETSDSTVKLTYFSQTYKTKLYFEIAFSANYPNEPCEIKITAEHLQKELVDTLNKRITEQQKTYLNDTEGYLYELITEIDDQFNEVVNYSPSESEESSEKAEVNHGLMPGRPCTEEAFAEWFKEYVEKHGIDLIEEDTWQHALYPGKTGYEYWEEKKNEDVVENE